MNTAMRRIGVFWLVQDQKIIVIGTLATHVCAGVANIQDRNPCPAPNRELGRQDLL